MMSIPIKTVYFECRQLVLITNTVSQPVGTRYKCVWDRKLNWKHMPHDLKNVKMKKKRRNYGVVQPKNDGHKLARQGACFHSVHDMCQYWHEFHHINKQKMGAAVQKAKMCNLLQLRVWV
jgi:hypothetical protein